MGFYVCVCFVILMLGNSKFCYEDVDLIVVCENMEGFYIGCEYEVVDGVVEVFKVVMCEVFECIVCFVFEYVCNYGCKKIIVVYKVLVMCFFDGFFFDCVVEIVEDYLYMEVELLLFDNFVMVLV